MSAIQDVMPKKAVFSPRAVKWFLEKQRVFVDEVLPGQRFYVWNSQWEVKRVSLIGHHEYAQVERIGKWGEYGSARN